MEKQRRIELEQKLLKQAREHYDRYLLLHRGITPWKQLVEQSHANAQVNQHTHTSGLTLIHSLTYHILHKAQLLPFTQRCVTDVPIVPVLLHLFTLLSRWMGKDKILGLEEKKMKRREKYTPNPISHKISKRSEPTSWAAQCENVDVI